MSNRQSQVTRNNARNAQQGEAEYFDLHTRGCGYLSRVRWVTPNSRGRKADPFLCCAINALHGNASDPSYTYFDLRVTGVEAQQLIASLENYVVQNKKVFVAFRIGDIYPHAYERNVKDQRTGKVTGTEQAALIKGRLLHVTHAKVDGVTIYSATDKTASESDQHPAGPDEHAHDNDGYDDRNDGTHG